MLGIALGAFARGAESGYGLGRQIKEDRRTDKNRRDLEAVDTEGKKSFEASGGEMGGGGNWDEYYAKFVVPRKAAKLLEQGDLGTAEAYRKYAETDGARRGARFFADGMLAGQAGDMKGAIGKFIEAGRTQGYGGDFQISDPEQTPGGGMKINLTGADGMAHALEFKTPDEVLRFGATYANPDAMFDNWLSTQQEAAKSGRELSTYKAKLGMQTQDALDRRDVGLGNKYDPRPARTAATWSAPELRKQALAELKDTTVYQEADEAEQQRMLQDRITAIGGAAGGQDEPPPAPRRVIVDTQSGAQIDPGAEAPQEASPGTDMPAIDTGLTPADREARPGASSRQRWPAGEAIPVDTSPARVARPAAMPGSGARERFPTGWQDPGPAPEPASPSEREAAGLVTPTRERWARSSSPAETPRSVIVNPDGTIVDANSGEHVGTASDEAITNAVERLKAGADPAVVRLALRTANVPVSAWPEELQPKSRATAQR